MSFRAPSASERLTNVRPGVVNSALRQSNTSHEEDGVKGRGALREFVHPNEPLDLLAGENSSTAPARVLVDFRRQLTSLNGVWVERNQLVSDCVLEHSAKDAIDVAHRARCKVLIAESRLEALRTPGSPRIPLSRRARRSNRVSRRGPRR